MDAVSYVSFFILHLALAKVVRGQAENEPSPDYEQLRDEFLQENIHVLSDQPVTAGAHDPDPWYTGENPFEEVQSTTPENDLLPVERNDFSDGESTIETDHATTEASQSFQPMESRTTTIEKIDTAVTETSILGKDTWDTVTLNETTAFADHLLTAETVEATSDLSDPNSSVDILHSEATEVVFIVPGKPSLEPMAAENVTKPYWEATVHQDVERNHEESEFVAEKGNTKQIYEDIKLEDDYRENHGSTVSDTTPSETLTTEMVPDVPSATVLAESSRSSVTPNIVLNISLDQESEVLVRILPRLILPDESLEAHLNATTVRSFVVINASDAEQSMNEDNHDVHSVENITGRTTELWFTTESVAPPNASSPATTDTFADTSTVSLLSAVRLVAQFFELTDELRPHFCFVSAIFLFFYFHIYGKWIPEFSPPNQ